MTTMTDQPIQTAANPAAVRAALRREKIAARLALPAAMQEAASTRVLDLLTSLLLPRPAGMIAFCWPIRAEVDCRPLVTGLLAAGWRAAMPAVVTVDAPMEFRAWWPEAPMVTDPYGIPIPALAGPPQEGRRPPVGGSEPGLRAWGANNPATAVSPLPDVVLLPLVAFDAAGYRLGYGGGYFDRTLAACVPRPLAIGVGFDLCAVPDIHPEAHDIPLDLIVTESGIHRINTP
ncbi:MAG: 5-formyltetrahydrofolate cyclo-ligase [Rhodocyclaceae bacterium]|nr:5-formyltetrahydrofolate cyclo-ligase [Rhodocyclaceae bacterium]